MSESYELITLSVRDMQNSSNPYWSLFGGAQEAHVMPLTSRDWHLMS